MIIAKYPLFKDDIKGSRSAKDKYVVALTWEYGYRYPQFSWKKKLKPAILKVVNNVVGLINGFVSEKGKISNIHMLRQFLTPGYQGEDLLAVFGEGRLRIRNEGLLLSCIRMDKNGLKEWFADESPKKHQAKYVEFIRVMAARVIKDICDETEKHIPDMISSSSSESSSLSETSSSEISDSSDEELEEQTSSPTDNVAPSPKRFRHSNTYVERYVEEKRKASGRATESR